MNDKLNQLRNRINQLYEKRTTDELSYSYLRVLLKEFGAINYPVKPFSFTMRLLDDDKTMMYNEKQVLEIDATAMIELLHTFRDDLTLENYETLCD
jgi:hypothetical protein